MPSSGETKEESKMKKRILALALCLALAVSLLPVTALADDRVPIVSGLEYGKTY